MSGMTTPRAGAANSSCLLIASLSAVLLFERANKAGCCGSGPVPTSLRQFRPRRGRQRPSTLQGSSLLTLGRPPRSLEASRAVATRVSPSKFYSSAPFLQVPGETILRFLLLRPVKREGRRPWLPEHVSWGRSPPWQAPTWATVISRKDSGDMTSATVAC